MIPFFLTYIIWILSEIFLNRMFRSGVSDKKNTDKNSELIIWITIPLSITAAIFASTIFYLPIYSSIYINYIGLVIIFAGIIFRFIAIKQLGKFFTVDVTIREDHKLLQVGIYKYLRHPSYSGSLLSFIGFGFAMNSWLSLLIAFLPVFFAIINRINIEEKVLVESFGGQYLDYKKKTKRLIPFIY